MAPLVWRGLTLAECVEAVPADSAELIRAGAAKWAAKAFFLEDDSSSARRYGGKVVQKAEDFAGPDDRSMLRRAGSTR